jgi:hypothetical protein
VEGARAAAARDARVRAGHKLAPLRCGLNRDTGPPMLDPETRARGARPGPRHELCTLGSQLTLAGGHEVEVTAQHGVELAGAPATIHVANQRRGLAAIAAHDGVRLLSAG